ncbi:hypothetical protein PU629_04685 [Pullulanibacillus sp. KACC 23026]|uniref:hypothetical protein n=1 Tax=Pullulanibacillus sp. KACC 23026 TaxID=3028315 RepID=UPI0023AF0312|nr:hypothetical protein [Pullulanibacillus sp. KACC 23026]WEG13667.1 hypothetical protein PU629_04685 [Pullulanibacillus sp. KACC 23026]
MQKLLRVIHRTAGLIGALFILFMAVTGILLNHRSLIGYSSNTQRKMQEFIFGLHSGNIGNLSIVWFTDLGAVCMIVLSLTGIWMWLDLLLRKKRRKKRV